MASVLLPGLVPGVVARREREPLGNIQRCQGKSASKHLDRFFDGGPTFFRYHRKCVSLACEGQLGSVILVSALLEQLGVRVGIRAQAVDLGHEFALERVAGGGLPLHLPTESRNAH